MLETHVEDIEKGPARRRQVPGHVPVVVLVDRHRGGSVRRGDDTDAVINGGIPHGALDLVRDGNHLVALVCLDRYVLYLHPSPPSGSMIPGKSATLSITKSASPASACHFPVHLYAHEPGPPGAHHIRLGVVADHGHPPGLEP